MRVAFIYGLGHHLLALTTNFLELRADRFEHAERVFIPRNMQHNSSFCEIPVRLPKSTTEVMALISPEDYPRVTAVADMWHISSSGYVVSSKRENNTFVATYLHRLIAGSPAKHINGDRLDNRRSNLILSNRHGKSPKRPAEMDVEELIMHSSHPLDDWTSSHPLSHKRQQTIDYGNGKFYSGEMDHGVPHGLGTLIETSRTSFGWFIQGKFKSGIVCDHPPCCDRLRYLYQQKHIRPIKNAFLVRNDGKHESLKSRGPTA
jgi:hypothetical protein